MANLWREHPFLKKSNKKIRGIERKGKCNDFWRNLKQSLRRILKNSSSEDFQKISFLFFCLYSLGVFLSSLSSIVCAAINNPLCCFLNNFLTPKLLSPQYLGLQSILSHLHFLIDTISLHYVQCGIYCAQLANFLCSCQSPLVEDLTTRRMLQNTSPLILPRC